MGTDRFGLQSLVKQAEPDEKGYDPDHPYISRHTQWSFLGSHLGSLGGAALAGKHLSGKNMPEGLALLMAGSGAGALAGHAASAIPGMIHGAISQRRDRPQEWNQDMGNVLDGLKHKLEMKSATLRPNQIEVQAIQDAFAHYKIAGPVGTMLQNAWKGVQNFGGQLRGAGQAAKNTYQAGRFAMQPRFSNLGNAAQSAVDHLNDSGAMKTLGKVGRGSALVGAGALAGHALTSQQPQQQRPPQNPYGQPF